MNIASTLKHSVVISLTAVATLVASSGLAAAEEHVRLKFDNCTAPQQAQVSKAMTLAAQALDVVVAQLEAPKPSMEDDAIVDRWFGTRTSGTVVAERLQFIADRLDFDAPAIVVECDITNRDTFAWTYRAMEGVGYLGVGLPFFTTAAIGGYDSRAGTIIHEFAHMVPEIAADDHTYAIREMEGLARDTPKVAFDNAQNYEYLVEQMYDAIIGNPISSFIGV